MEVFGVSDGSDGPLFCYSNFLANVFLSCCKEEEDSNDFFSSSSETIARCWYILLSGSVLMKDSMFLPPCRYVKLLLLFKVRRDIFF